MTHRGWDTSSECETWQVGKEGSRGRMAPTSLFSSHQITEYFRLIPLFARIQMLKKNTDLHLEKSNDSLRKSIFSQNH